MKQFEQEVETGERFEFGSNWTLFLGSLDDARVLRAEESLCSMLGVKGLEGKRFLDIGSGSGLFSLAARRLGADVYSFDYDPNSVACAKELRQRYFNGDSTHWNIEEGSALDPAYLRSLGKFDVVYSWGVLHHTGAMWKALDNATIPMTTGGQLFIAIYNDQGPTSKRWTAVKRMYCKSSAPLKFVIAAGVLITQWWKPMVKDFLRMRPFSSWREYGKLRGMHPWRDVIDWAGGYPFEVASPDEIFDFYRKRGFVMTRMKTDRGSGCNEFVFRLE